MNFTHSISIVFILFFCGYQIKVSHAGRCEKVSSSLCKNLGYNSTQMPNFMGHDSQINADLGLRAYEPFLNHKCSKYIRLFICSVFVPMCSEHVPRPIQACRGLCEKVKDDCYEALRSMNLSWPAELNCTRFPEPSVLCMQQPSEDNEITQTHAFTNDELSYYSNCPPNTIPNGRTCIPICTGKQQLDPEEIATFEIWVAVWSIIGIIFTVFGMITFVIQPKRFRWPARPILYLTSCGFVTCIIYLIRWFEGPYTCAGDFPHERPAESLSCVGISLILLFCDIAYTLWWTVFSFVWFLSATKEWSTEAIEKISTRLHTTVWILSAVPMFYVLMSNNITINYLSGFCEVKNQLLVLFQLFFMVVSCILAVFTSVALKNVRAALVTAGRSPLKLERLFYRLLIISIGICLPHFLYLLCQFYDTFSMPLFKLVSRKISIIFATLWVYSPKTFDMWCKILCICRNKETNNSDRQQSIFKSFVPRIFLRDEEKVNQFVSSNAKNINLISESKRTIFNRFFASTAHNNAPVSRV